MTDLEILQLLVKAKELGITSFEIAIYKQQAEKQQTKAVVPDLKPSEIVVPGSSFDDLSDEETLYWASPYYDEIQIKKEAQKRKLAENTND